MGPKNCWQNTGPIPLKYWLFRKTPAQSLRGNIPNVERSRRGVVASRGARAINVYGEGGIFFWNGRVCMLADSESEQLQASITLNGDNVNVRNTHTSIHTPHKSTNIYVDAGYALDTCYLGCKVEWHAYYLTLRFDLHEACTDFVLPIKCL